jgi:uncharacterized coiled-coil DUF342 family protein
MGLGSTAKKIQKVAEGADELSTKVNELKAQLQDLRGTVEETNEQVDDLERELAEQRGLLEALAEQQGIDPDAASADALIADAEADGGSAGTTADDAQ